MNDLALERHYTPKQVAEIWGISPNTVRKMFEDMPGVLKINHPTLTARKHTKRVTMRIPASLLAVAHEQGAGVFRAKIQRGNR